MSVWTVLGSRYLLRRWWMNLREDHVRLPDGRELPEFHVVEYPDWVCVVCATPDRELVLVEQYRHGIGRMSIECPAGAVEPGEHPLDAARRELLEETGYASDHWVLVGQCVPEPSKHTNRAYLYFARDATPTSEPTLDAEEDLILRIANPDEVFRMIEHGSIFHGIHLTALFWARLQGMI
jgi:8-oxo-dGTP pyrophosphatase MutT (NUDIX family)